MEQKRDREWQCEADKQAGERADKQAGERADKQAGERASKQAGERADKQAGERASERAGDYFVFARRQADCGVHRRARRAGLRRGCCDLRGPRVRILSEGGRKVVKTGMGWTAEGQRSDER